MKNYQKLVTELQGANELKKVLRSKIDGHIVIITKRGFKVIFKEDDRRFIELYGVDGKIIHASKKISIILEVLAYKEATHQFEEDRNKFADRMQESLIEILNNPKNPVSKEELRETLRKAAKDADEIINEIINRK